MNFDKADRELAHWRDRLQLAGENLREFAMLPAYQWAVSGAATGQTAARVAAVAPAMNDLHAYLDLLSGVVGRAAALRQNVSRIMPSSSTLREIEELLEGRSITCAANPTPPEQRELLRPIQTTQAISPRELLESMLESFRLVRDVVLTVDAARARASAAVAKLEQDVGAASAAGYDGAAISARLAALKSSAGSDPIGAEAQAEELATYLQSAHQRVAAAAAQRESACAALADCRTLLARLQQVHERARKAYTERTLKVDDGSSLGQFDESALASIAAWLQKLQQTINAGNAGPASVGLTKWRMEAERRLAADEAVAREAEAALSRRRDLCGLLDALAAKARQAGRANEAELSSLAAQAVELLRRRPAPMARASAIIKEYEARLL